MKTSPVATTFACLAGLLLLSASALAGAADYMTPEYALAKYRPKTMVLIPPMAEVVKNKVASTEQMIEEGAVLEDAAAAVLKKMFAELGYQLHVVTVDEVNADPDLQRMVRAMNDRYDEELHLMAGRGKDIRSRRFSFGDEARILAARLQAEAIVISRISASGATGGQKTMAVLIGGSIGHAAMSIGIIAGDNGDVEGFFSGIESNVSPEKIANQPVETMAGVSQKLLKDYPAAGEVAKVKKSWPQETNRVVPATGAHDEDVLSDLESLLEEN